ncbi:polysaccharide deacetylase family protein [Nocardioides panaciterrulae]|uniref:NodB homology domain-containing protein n=1 Tax=Nocardioides panaciterrulae TaxID=661492 RepID=A0A7Y9E3W0_9ACTN|nr:polysaccharide deacetylase family protein [Nocardioides panaciterrulae]NYD40475.1 hypothetical protein [Nocardioides panaciterrulae]
MWTLMDNSSDSSAPGYHYTTGSEWVEMTLPFSYHDRHPNRTAITQVNLRIGDNGATNPITVWFQSVDAVEDETPTFYPNGVVSIAFDDDTSDQWANSIPYLASKGLTGTLFVLGDTLDPNGFMTTAQVRSAQDDYGFEVASQSATLAGHSTDFRNGAPSDVRREMRGITKLLADEGFNAWEHLAYPKVAVHRRLMDDVASVFTSARTTVRPNYHETMPPGDAFRLRTWEVLNTDAPASIKAAIDQAKAKRGWLILTFHISRRPVVQHRVRRRGVPEHHRLPRDDGHRGRTGRQGPLQTSDPRRPGPRHRPRQPSRRART